MLKSFWHFFVAFGLLFTSMMLIMLTLISIEQFNKPYVLGVLAVHLVVMIYSVMIVFVTSSTDKKRQLLIDGAEAADTLIALLTKKLEESQAREGLMRSTLFVNAIRAYPNFSNEDIEKEIDRVCPKNDTTALDEAIKRGKMEVLNEFVARGVISTDGEIYQCLNQQFGAPK